MLRPFSPGSQEMCVFTAIGDQEVSHIYPSNRRGARRDHPLPLRLDLLR